MFTVMQVVWRFHTFKGNGYIFHFPPFFTRETTFMPSCLLSWTPVPFWKYIYFKYTEFVSKGSKFLPFRVNYVLLEKKIHFYSVAESTAIPLHVVSGCTQPPPQLTFFIPSYVNYSVVLDPWAITTILHVELSRIDIADSYLMFALVWSIMSVKWLF